MKFTVLLSLLALVACNNKNESLVRSHLEKNMKLESSNLEIDSITLGEEKVPKAEDKQGLALFGLKDMKAFPITVTFKAKEDCIAVAEALKNDVLFNEKKVSCRSMNAKVAPEKKYVKAYVQKGFRRIASWEEGKVLKAGEKFTVAGELLYTTTFKDEKKDGTILYGIKE